MHERIISRQERKRKWSECNIINNILAISVWKTRNLLLPKFQVIRAIKAADRFLPNNVVHKYYSNGIIDLYYNNQKRKSAEDLVDIDMFINNLRYSYTRPYDIYKDAVVDHLDHENVRAVLSFGSLNLGATDSMHHED